MTRSTYSPIVGIRAGREVMISSSSSSGVMPSWLRRTRTASSRSVITTDISNPLQLRPAGRQPSRRRRRPCRQRVCRSPPCHKEEPSASVNPAAPPNGNRKPQMPLSCDRRRGSAGRDQNRRVGPDVEPECGRLRPAHMPEQRAIRDPACPIRRRRYAIGWRPGGHRGELSEWDPRHDRAVTAITVAARRPVDLPCLVLGFDSGTAIHDEASSLVGDPDEASAARRSPPVSAWPQRGHPLPDTPESTGASPPGRRRPRERIEDRSRRREAPPGADRRDRRDTHPR